MMRHEEGATDIRPDQLERVRVQARSGCLRGILILLTLVAVLVGAGLGLDALLEAIARDGVVGRLHPPLIAGAAGTTALWLGAVAAYRVARQPRDPRPAPASADLGAESPAVANMLANDFRPTRDAVPATLLDLAARRIVEIETSAAGSWQVRLRASPPSGLAPYETRVHHLLQRKAAGGVVAAGALTTGPTDHARGWWRAFRREVEAEARARGLAEDLWTGTAITVLTVLAVIPAMAIGLAAVHIAAGVGAFGAAASLVSALKAGGRQRHTDTGLRAAAHWLGVRRYLRDGAFGDLPPTAVAVWERYLAYAAGLGVAAGAVRAFPMGADDDRRAWSAASGQWRQVRVRYPVAWPPGWGMHPGGAAVIGVIMAGMAMLFLRVTLGLGWTDPGLGVFRLLGLLFVGIPLLLAATGITMLVLGLGDLRTPRAVTGLVLRRRSFSRGQDQQPRHFLALDDGASPVIRAWRLRPEVHRFAGVLEDRWATASVTPNLGYVRWIRPAEPPGGGPGPARRSRP